MIGLDQVNFRKNGTARHMIIEGLDVEKGVQMQQGRPR